MKAQVALRLPQEWSFVATIRQDPEGALVLAREWEAFAHAFNAFVLSSLAILFGATQK